MTMTQEERLSRLEASYEILSTVAINMVTKDEMQAQQSATEEKLRAEMRAMELIRIIRWMVGTILAATTVAVSTISTVTINTIRLPA